MVERTRGVLPSEGAECAVPIPGPGPGPVPDPGPVPVSCHVVSCIFFLYWTRYNPRAHGGCHGPGSRAHDDDLHEPHVTCEFLRVQVRAP